MTYNIIDNIFSRMSEPMCAAEAHGVATAMLCTNIDSTSHSWLAHVITERQELLQEEEEILVSLFERTKELLLDEGFTYDLLLPDEDDAIAQTAYCIKVWCQGFLYGAGCSETALDWQGDNREILKDIDEFTKLDSSAVTEDDADDLMEIHEYLRAAVVLLMEQQDKGVDPQILH